MILRRVDRIVRISRFRIRRSRAALEASRKVLDALPLDPASHPAFLRSLCERRTGR